MPTEGWLHRYYVAEIEVREAVRRWFCFWMGWGI